MKEKEAFVALFRKVQVSFSRVYAAIFEKVDLTFPQYALLNLLSSCPQPITMSKASQGLYISKPAITSLVDRLEEKKLLKRVDHPEDRRAHLLEVQPEGKKLTNELQEFALQFLLKALDQSNPEEQNTIRRFYTLIDQSMEEINTGCCKNSDEEKKS